MYPLLADAVVLLHLLFVVFVATGGVAVLRWRQLAWLHLPCALWGVIVELSGRVCPLTPLENRLRRMGGQSGYEGGFIDQYLVPVLYPTGLTRQGQVILGILAAVINLAIYGRLLWPKKLSPTDRNP
jgi:hypothetical protein